jgi:hypothetical protein
VRYQLRLSGLGVGFFDLKIIKIDEPQLFLREVLGKKVRRLVL